MKIARLKVIISLVGSVLATVPILATSQASYPNQPLKLIVPYPAGGGTDYFARQVAPAMGESLGQPVIVENRAGASGIIGASAVAHQLPADGYSFLLGDMTTYAVNPVMFEKLQYNVERDFVPVTMTAKFEFLLVVNPQVLPVNTVAELVAASLKAPTGLNYASPSTGTTHHLAMEMFARQTGAKLVAITYKGGGPAVQDLLAGQVALMFLDRATARPHLESGKLRAIAAAGSKRIAAYPNVPTVAESGVKDFSVEGWQGFMVRKGTPDTAVRALNAAYAKAIASTELRKRLDDAGIDAVGSTPEQFGRYVLQERGKWKAVISERNIKAE